MGIGYFPAPHPDELLYSVCARYGTWSGRPGWTFPETRFSTQTNGTS